MQYRRRVCLLVSSEADCREIRGLATPRFITLLTRDRLSTLYLKSLFLMYYLLSLGLRVGFTIKIPHEFVLYMPCLYFSL